MVRGRGFRCRRTPVAIQSRAVRESASRVPMIHPQIRLEWGEQSADIDTAIAPVVLELWKAGWVTVLSCEAHAAAGKVWIQFMAAGQAEDFLNVVAPYSDARAASIAA
jgi:hypothetical protein